MYLCTNYFCQKHHDPTSDKLLFTSQSLDETASNLGPSYLGVFPPFLQSRWGGPAALQSIRGMDLVSVLAKQLDRQGSWVRLGRYHKSKQARAALRCTN